MSNAVLTIRTDSNTKAAIAGFAASVGLSVSGFMLASAMQAVRQQRLTLSPNLEPTPFLEQSMAKAKADQKAGRNYTKVDSKAELDDLFKSL